MGRPVAPARRRGGPTPPLEAGELPDPHPSAAPYPRVSRSNFRHVPLGRSIWEDKSVLLRNVTVSLQLSPRQMDCAEA